MDETSLAWFIQHYINERRRIRLEAFDKDAAKKLASLTSHAEIQAQTLTLAQEHAKIVARYKPQVWLADAACRAAQISLVTHAAKFTHSDAKGSSFFIPQTKSVRRPVTFLRHL